MTRSLWKGTFLKESILKHVKTFPESKKQKRVWSRGSTITSQLVGYTFQVYNGKKFIPVRVTSEMVGHKFGEFSATRSRRVGKFDKK